MHGDCAPPPPRRPLLATSTLSPHTADLAKDGRCSITVMDPKFQAGAPLRVQQLHAGLAPDLPLASPSAVLHPRAPRTV
jgi:hypothetical protein